MAESGHWTEPEFERALRDLAAAIDYPPTPDLSGAVCTRLQHGTRRSHLHVVLSSDTPQPVVEPIDRLTARQELPQRRLRRDVLLALAGSLVVVAAGVLFMFVFATSPNHHDKATAPVAVPDTLIATDFDRGSTTYSVSAYMPGDTAFQPVLDNGSRPVISPDGRQLVSTQVTRDGDTIHIGVVALASDSLKQEWQTEVATFPAAQMKVDNLSTIGASVAITNDRVYVSPAIWNSRDPLALVVLDRETGREIKRWSIALNEQSASAGTTIYASPDGTAIWLLDPMLDPISKQQTSMLYLRIDTASGRVEDRHELIGADGKPYFPYGNMAPDGHTLYIVGAWAPYSSPLPVSFFDLSTGTLQPALSLPLQTTDAAPDHEEATSADGRTLYILLPTLGKVMIVDLTARAVLQIQPVEGLTADGPSLFARVFGALRDLVVQPAAAKFYFSGNMQLSPDGTRLYAVGIKGSGYAAVPSGIIAIDTTNWRVTSRWMSDAQVSFLQLGSDGTTLYVQAADKFDQWALTALDTRTGNARTLTSRSDLSNDVTSLPQLYRESYGTAPGRNSSPTAPQVSIARLDISVDRTNMLAGDSVTVDARFVDPQSGAPLKPGETNVQFDPPAKVAATFFHGQMGTGDITVELQPVGYGHYRGSVVLREPQKWSLQVDATRANGPTNRAQITSAIVVQPAYAGSDGRRYQLRMTVDPASPTSGQELTLRVEFVDAERNTPLPAGVELTGGTPSSLDAAFFLGTDDPSQAPQQMISAKIEQTGHGIYTDRLTFDKVGSWAVQLNFRLGSQSISLTTGTIEVGAP